MKTPPKLAAALLLAALNAQLTTSFAQGSLTPPGAPAATMKTLAQIEPRTPIAAAPFTISEPGSYYLTTNLIAANGNIITITTNNITLDLNGFALMGGSTASYGVMVPNFQTNIVIRNGHVTGFGFYGIYAANVYGGRFERLLVRDNTYVGLMAGRAGIVSDCQALFNGGDGILAASYMAVVNCSAYNNKAVGIHVHETRSRIENNHMVSNGCGIKVETSGNLIIHNSVANSVTNNYSVASGNLFGPVVNSSTIATNSNPHANYDY